MFCFLNTSMLLYSNSKKCCIFLIRFFTIWSAKIGTKIKGKFLTSCKAKPSTSTSEETLSTKTHSINCHKITVSCLIFTHFSSNLLHFKYLAVKIQLKFSTSIFRLKKIISSRAQLEAEDARCFGQRGWVGRSRD